MTKLARPVLFVGDAAGPVLHDGVRTYFAPRRQTDEFNAAFWNPWPAYAGPPRGVRERPRGTWYGYWLSNNAEDVAAVRALIAAGKLPGWGDVSATTVDQFRDVSGWVEGMTVDEELAWLWRQRILATPGDSAVLKMLNTLSITEQAKYLASPSEEGDETAEIYAAAHDPQAARLNAISEFQPLYRRATLAVAVFGQIASRKRPGLPW